MYSTSFSDDCTGPPALPCSMEECYNIVICQEKNTFTFYNKSPQGHSTTCVCIKLLFRCLKMQPFHGISLSMEMSRLTRDGTAEPVSRDQILRHARGQGNIHFPCSADHEQDWQPYPVDPYPAICDDYTYIHTYTTVHGTPEHNNNYKRHDNLGYSSICYIESKIGWVSMEEVYKLQI